MDSNLFKIDRAGLAGISGVGVGFINLILFSNENLILFALMMLLCIISMFLVFKDRNDKEAFKIFIGLILITGSLFILLLFSNQL